MVVDGYRVNGLTIVVDVGQVSLGGSAYATKRGQIYAVRTVSGGVVLRFQDEMTLVFADCNQ